MKGWRTVAFNIAAALPLVAEQVLQLVAWGDLAGLVPVEWQGIYALAVIVANVYLRSITSTPLGRRQ